MNLNELIVTHENENVIIHKTIGVKVFHKRGVTKKVIGSFKVKREEVLMFHLMFPYYKDEYLRRSDGRRWLEG